MASWCSLPALEVRINQRLHSEVQAGLFWDNETQDPSQLRRLVILMLLWCWLTYIIIQAQSRCDAVLQDGV